MHCGESTALGLKGRNPFASCDQARARREYEQITGCSPAVKVALPERERAAPTDSTARVVRGTGTQFRGRVSGRSAMATAFNTAQPEREREFGESSGVAGRLSLLLLSSSGSPLPNRACWCSEKQAPAKS